MTPKYCIISLMILQLHSARSGSSREAIIGEEISHWCKAHPFGRIYSNGNYHTCSHEQEDKKEDQVKNLNMNGVSLRIGIIPVSDYYILLLSLVSNGFNMVIFDRRIK